MIWDMTDDYSAAAIFIGTFSLTFLIWSKLRQNGSRRLPPSLRSLPLVGSLPFLPGFDKFHTFFLEKSYKLGDVFLLRAFNLHIAVLNSYEAMHEVLVKHSFESADRPVSIANDQLNPHCKGIIDAFYNSDFKKYHQLSLSILKEFGFGQNIMEDRINFEVEDLLNKFKQLNGSPVYPKDLVAKSVLSVITSITLGDRLEDQTESESLAKSVDEIFKYGNDVFMGDLLQAFKYLPSYKSALKKMVSAQGVLMRIVDKNIALNLSPDPSVAPPPESFISSFISREGENFDLEQLRYTLRDFLLAGFETSSSIMIWFFIAMGNHPDMQEKAQKELDAVVPRSRLPSLEDKAKLPYFEAATLEVMRYHTLLQFGLFHNAMADINVCGYIIPKDTTILTNIYSAHMNKKSWDEPEVFKPERFLNDDGTQVINKEKVIPFSMGKRSCLGELLARQEIYLFITGLLQNFIIRPPEGLQKIEYGTEVSSTIQPTPFLIRFLNRA